MVPPHFTPLGGASLGPLTRANRRGLVGGCRCSPQLGRVVHGDRTPPSQLPAALSASAIPLLVSVVAVEETVAGCGGVPSEADANTRNGYVRKPYASAEVDLVAVYCGELDRCFLVAITLVDDHQYLHLRLRPARNGQRSCINLETTSISKGL